MSPVDAELARITTELESRGFAQTFFERLDLTYDETAAQRIRAACEDKPSSKAALELTELVDKDGITIVQDEACMEDGRDFVRPIVDILFRDSSRAREKWSAYALNCYETGGHFGEHRDSIGATVLIVSVTGHRELSIGEQPKVERLTMPPGSITLLDAEHDPVHAVRCTEGPSISVVLDVPDMLRSSYR
ncbi:hypothetical protein DSM112329_00192 [Paraconexibacter sp. AEG42_29]|uniref:Fe2OG dioxygenase domain-containing protein n=1 Tax=Paraconexibacter sp. AEG42_29 TaxID=2997339 RepID=A0AAU7APE2_9ACTN